MADDFVTINANFKEVKKELATKQDTISDLDTIRSGATAGSTALQSVPDTVALKTDIPDTSTFMTATQVDSAIDDKLGNVSILAWDDITTTDTTTE